MAWEVEHNMPVDEFHDWLAYLQWKAEQEIKAAEKSKRKAGAAKRR